MNHKQIDKVGNELVGWFHRLALFGIGAATVWAAGYTCLCISFLLTLPPQQNGWRRLWHCRYPST